MIIDNNLMLFNDEAVTTATTYVSDTVKIDQGESGGVVGTIVHLGSGEPMELVFKVTQAFTGGTTTTFRFISGNTAALGGAAIQFDAGAFAPGVLVEGYTIKIPLRFTTGDPDATHTGAHLVQSGTATAGTVSAWIQRANEDQNTVNDLGVDLQD